MMSAQKNSILLLEKEIKNMTKKLTTTYEFFIFCDFCTKIRYTYIIIHSNSLQWLALERDGDWGKKKENVI